MSLVQVNSRSKNTFTTLKFFKSLEFQYRKGLELHVSFYAVRVLKGMPESQERVRAALKDKIFSMPFYQCRSYGYFFRTRWVHALGDLTGLFPFMEPDKNFPELHLFDFRLILLFSKLRPGTLWDMIQKYVRSKVLLKFSIDELAENDIYDISCIYALLNPHYIGDAKEEVTYPITEALERFARVCHDNGFDWKKHKADISKWISEYIADADCHLPIDCEDLLVECNHTRVYEDYGQFQPNIPHPNTMTFFQLVNLG